MVTNADLLHICVFMHINLKTTKPGLHTERNHKQKQSFKKFLMTY